MQQRHRPGGWRIGHGLAAFVALVGWVTAACAGNGDNDAAVEADSPEAAGSQGVDGDDGDRSQPDGSDSASPGDLVGRTFVAESMTESGEERPLVDGTEIEVGFPEEGRVSASAGCNGMGAPVTVDDGRITLVEDLERTLMLCEPQELMDQEAWLAGFLQSGPSYALEGARLTMETGEARLELVAASVGSDTTGRPPDGVDTGAGDAAEAPAGKTELPGTTWQVTGLVDGNTTTSVPEGVVATMTFEDDGRAITVETCNGGGGDVDISETRMTFAPVAMTRRLCPGEQGTTEAVMLGVLRGEVSYRLDGDTLVLRHPEDKALTLRPA